MISITKVMVGYLFLYFLDSIFTKDKGYLMIIFLYSFLSLFLITYGMNYYVFNFSVLQSNRPKRVVKHMFCLTPFFLFTSEALLNFVRNSSTFPDNIICMLSPFSFTLLIFKGNGVNVVKRKHILHLPKCVNQ